MATWGGDFAASETDAESPLTTGLMTKIADDCEFAKTAFAYKSADEPVNNSTVMQNDDDLFFPIAANEKWVFEFHLSVTTSAVADFKVATTGPAALTLGISHYYAYLGNTLVHAEVLGLGANVPILYGAQATFQPLMIFGFIDNGVNAGNVNLTWAQNVAEATDTKVVLGSWMAAHRVDWT